MFWAGETLGNPIAFDTETELIKDELTIPTLSIMTVSDGAKSYVVHPDDVSDFLKKHSKHRWYGYNAVFDFWVLSSSGRTLWDTTNDGRLCCLRLLRRLVRLAVTGEPDRRGTLADACREYGVSEPDKSDPYRLRYGELIGLTKAQILEHPEAQGFLSYALFDAETTFALIKPMEEHARRISQKNQAQFHPDHERRFGLLSVAIQTRADIVLAHLSRQGLRIDREALDRVEQQTRERMAEIEDLLEAGCPGLWKVYKKTGQRMTDKKSGLPKATQSVIRAKLASVAKEHDRPALTKTNAKGESVIALEAERWLRWVTDDWVKLWHEYGTLRKRLGVWLNPMKSGVVYSRYEVLMNTGRTSASKTKGLPSVPIQQAPRDKDFRAMFVAEPGTLRLTIDYSYLELRTLAACCLVRLGKSTLGDAIRKHTEAFRKGRKDVPDPHELTGSYMLGVSPEEFLRLPKDARKSARQKAKAVNFGCPGGLGADRLVDYAKANYDVTLSRQEAKQLKERWMETYPEMREWLSDSTLQNLAQNLKVSERCVTQYLGKHLWHARECVEGLKEEESARSVIESIKEMNRNEALTELLAGFDYSTEHHETLSEAILKGVSCTPTGRVRAKVGYTDGANNPFQGLASDGAKEALWRLLYAGYPVRAFLHDEVLIDLPEATATRLRPRIHKILNQAMEDVMLNGVPCETESNLGPCWMKG